MKDWIEQGLRELALSPAPDAADKLARYGELLIEKNQVMNLTAITEPKQVACLHMLDCAALLKSVDLKGKRLIDVGTGAGFPGLVLKILEPTLELTLLDGLQKRLNWLSEVARELDLGEVNFLHARAEEAAAKAPHREAYDLATARAVADMSMLSEMCLPYVKVGGTFCAMKSVDSAEELTRAEGGIRLLGGRVAGQTDYTIPHIGVTHRLVLIDKTAPTPKQYPRRWAKVQKDPLSGR